MERLRERDYWILCLACGSVTPGNRWTYWQREETEDGLQWRVSEQGEGDPMMRCPSCRWEHVDDDSSPGLFDGTRAEVEAYKRAVEPGYGDVWDPARHGWQRECRAKSWQLEGFAICRGPWGHDGGHMWEVQ